MKTEPANDAPPATPDPLAEPFIAATELTLHEMAAIEVAVQSVGDQALPASPSEITVALDLTGARPARLLLSFPQGTARALAERMLAGTLQAIADELIHDCMGEIANVLGGQAKALLFGTPHHFALGTPRVLIGPRREPGADQHCLAVLFASDQGDFALHVYSTD